MSVPLHRHRYRGLAAASAVATSALWSMNAFGGEHVEPSGRNLGSAVQFDAVIEFHQRSSACDVVLFARYWVSTNFYYLGVVWGEPHGRGLDFSVYPPTMTIGSTEQAFKVGHQLNPGRNFEATKPFGSRGAFKSMFGDYAVSNARFAEQGLRVRVSLCLTCLICTLPPMVPNPP